MRTRASKLFRPLAGLLQALAVLVSGLEIAPGAEPRQAPEYEVKAAWLLNLIRFTDWPALAFSSPDAPFVVGVVGKDPFGPDLEKIVSGKTMNGRSIVVKRLSADQDLKQCHLLFVAASEKRRERDLMDKLKALPILTVGEREDFLDHGGAVQFHLVNDSVRFSVNLFPARSTRLRINANVLRLATSVRGKYD